MICDQLGATLISELNLLPFTIFGIWCTVGFTNNDSSLLRKLVIIFSLWRILTNSIIMKIEKCIIMSKKVEKSYHYVEKSRKMYHYVEKSYHYVEKWNILSLVFHHYVSYQSFFITHEPSLLVKRTVNANFYWYEKYSSWPQIPGVWIPLYSGLPPWAGSANKRKMDQFQMIISHEIQQCIAVNVVSKCS